MFSDFSWNKYLCSVYSGKELTKNLKDIIVLYKTKLSNVTEKELLRSTFSLNQELTALC